MRLMTDLSKIGIMKISCSNVQMFVNQESNMDAAFFLQINAEKPFQHLATCSLQACRVHWQQPFLSLLDKLI